MTAFHKGRWQGLSGMQGNLHVPFLGGWAGAILPGYPAGESNLASLSRPVCRRSKMVATGTRRPRRGARLCRRWVCNGDKMVSFSTSIDALQSGWNVKNLRDLINLVSAFPGLDHGVGQPLASGLPHACPHVLLGDRGP
jgi:hypothetical protein